MSSIGSSGIGCTKKQYAARSHERVQARVKPLIADVPGWLTDEEGEALFELARSCTGKGVIVEIGSWKGKSTVCLGLGSQSGAVRSCVCGRPTRGLPLR